MTGGMNHTTTSTSKMAGFFSFTY